nr:S8 family serine peptidase [Neorhizobium tomejilense]
MRATLGGNLVRLDLTETHRYNGDSRLVISIDKGSRPIQDGRWRLQHTGRKLRSPGGLLSIWYEDQRGNQVRFDAASLEGSLSVPATAEYVVSVAACTSDEELTLAPFTSRGRTRDDRMKPDLCAPGVFVRSALASRQIMKKASR